MTDIDKEIIRKCQQKLIETKEELLNLKTNQHLELSLSERGGDEADLSSRAVEEIRNLGMGERIRNQLMEIELALSRIRDGSFGFCEETGEVIEQERLLAIPWTRLSIEGAELRESQHRRYVKY